MKTYNKLTALLLVLVLVLAVLAGCSTGTASPTPTQEPAATDTPDISSPEVSDTPEASGRTVTDQYGNVVELPETVNTICGTFPAIDAIVVMLGAGDKLVATTASNQTNPWMIRMVPNIAELPTPFVDTSAGNVEELMRIAPDVTICSSQADFDTITSAGLTAVRVDTSSMAAIQNYIVLIGEILGGEHLTKSQGLLAYYEDNLDTVTSVTDAIAKEDRPTVFYAASGVLNTEGSGSIVKEWIEVAGGVNVAAENGIDGMFVDVTAEQLMEWDPDIIICRDASQKAEYESDPTLSALSAVQNGKVYVNPYGVFKWCVRSADEAIQPLWAATVIQPDLFTDIDMVEETRSFHVEFYGLDLTDEEVQSILFPAAS
jgi:iron complex transport system substrate-binding protein